MLTVIADCGDFRRSAEFRMNEVIDTHAAGYWPCGITFRMSDGRRVRVCGKLLVRDDGYVCDINDTSSTYRWREL